MHTVRMPLQSDPPPRPPAGGLYDLRHEHDACGVGFLAHLRGEPSHELVDRSLRALERMAHRGATGADAATGDGAGILLQLPDALFRHEASSRRIVQLDGMPLGALPPLGHYAAGVVFTAPEPQAAALARLTFALIARQEGLALLGWRRVPTCNTDLGETARSVEPVMDHVFLGLPDGAPVVDEAGFERTLYVIRQRFQSAIRASGIDDRQFFHVTSLSSRTITYKGMLTPLQLRSYFPDLSHPLTASALCLFHSRFSTNTFPSWELAHPYHVIAHNGEINTLRGNINWMRAREAMLASPLFGDDIARVLPVVREGLSDSACLDNVLQLLVHSGRSLPHAVMMLLPEAWEHQDAMSAERRAFYAYHACVMEPWDGPACVTFTDGRQVGVVLDRNGLRPARYWVTDDDLVIMASEVGVVDVPADRIVEKGRLQPGRMFLVDLDEHRIVSDDEIKQRMATAHPYGTWLHDHFVPLDALAPGAPVAPLTAERRRTLQQAFGYTQEDLRLLMAPMALTGEEPTGSMGHDAALAVLSDQPRPLADYFQQLFAQVTNPPLDAIRERLVTSVATAIGPERNLLESGPEHCRMVGCPTPFLDNDAMARFKALERRALPPPVGVHPQPFTVSVLDMMFPAHEGPDGLEPALRAMCAKADTAIAQGAGALILSDRAASADLCPIPSLLAVAGLHNHLVRERTRTRVTLLVEAGDAREVHHFATLIGYGASAVNPWLALESLPELRALGLVDDTVDDAALRATYLGAVTKGVVKVMSKMGISTIASYRGAQIFEAVGLATAFVDRYFTNTPSRIGGLSIADVAAASLVHHDRAWRLGPQQDSLLLPGGQYQWRRDGEHHLFNPETVFALQHATRTGRTEIFRRYTRAVDDQSARRATLRGLLQFRTGVQPAVPLEEVEPASAIVRRFVSGAMSYGSISEEAHETLAIAMNRLGARSNSGEGGEDARRYTRDAHGDDRRSAIKQVASGRFGVTSEYLIHADELQIKMAQGAKPGEGGQLPGAKVYPWIAAVRHSTPGIGLISPPPHHDIYSIEDLAQLIFDLRHANPKAEVSVKLVAEAGVGTVAAGVAKARADRVLISGHDGGTGASPLTSIKHAGIPWEIGLADTQQTLVANRLRDRVVVQVDGQMKTGRDVVIAALLGAEEFGFATAPLVVMGCVMMRVCHLDTCPVGIATQDPELRRTFAGKAEHLVNFFHFIAEEVREYMAALGVRSMDALIGRVDLLEMTPSRGPAGTRGLDLSRVLSSTHMVGRGTGTVTLRRTRPPVPLEDGLDAHLLRQLGDTIDQGAPVVLERPIGNEDRAVGTRIGSAVTRRHGAAGLADDTIDLRFTGSAGQSFGAFLPRGVTLRLEGDANDYVGKGLSGGRIVLRPSRSARFDAAQNVIAGNVLLYGATSGEAFIRGLVGERFAVRNSGAVAVVEGVGDHGCEYMTGGRVVILGVTGRNFAAGMSGGMAFVFDPDGTCASRCHPALAEPGPLDDDEAAEVHALLTRHAALTDSTRARDLLQDWPSTRRQFVAVVPQEFRAVQAAARAAALRVAV